jgi:hypothetical protein
MSLRRTEASLIAASVCGTLLGPVAAPAMQKDADQVVFDDPRPLAAAVLELEHRCHCVITYEDFKWTQSQVEDAAQMPTRSPNGPRLQVPKGRPLTVALISEVDAKVPGEMPAALQAVFDAFEQAGNPGAFRIVSTRTGFHVVPAEHALFDVPVTLPGRTRSLAQAIPEILAEAGAASGNRILVGRVPVNLLIRTTTDGGASGERFGDVLERILASTGRAISWRLLYDFGMNAYYLNLHGVT